MSAATPAPAIEAKAASLRRELSAMHAKRHGLDEAIQRRKEALNRLEARAVLNAPAPVPAHDA
jgi:hypothetical protein